MKVVKKERFDLKHQEHLLTRDFWLIAAVNLFVMTAYYSLMVTTAKFASDRFNATTSIAGLVAGITVIGILISRFSSGYLTQQFSTKTLLVVGACLLVPATIGYHFVTSIFFLLLVRLVHGLAIGLISTVTNTAVILLFPVSRKGEGISYFSLSTILGTAIGPFTGLILMQTVGFTILFNIEIILSLLALIVSLLINSHKIRFVSRGTKRQVQLQDFLEPKAFPISLVMFLVGLSYAALQAYLSFYAGDLHLTTYASYFFLVYAVAILLSRPLTGRLLDAFGATPVIIPSLIIEIGGLVLLSSTHSGIGILGAALLIGLGFGNFQSAAQTIVAKIVTIERISQSTATFFILFDLSIGVGPYLLGLIEPAIGYRSLFLVTAIIVLIGLILYYNPVRKFTTDHLNALGKQHNVVPEKKNS